MYLTGLWLNKVINKKNLFVDGNGSYFFILYFINIKYNFIFIFFDKKNQNLSYMKLYQWDYPKKIQR